MANRYRADLARAGIGAGRHGYRLELPVAPGTAGIVLRRCADHATLPGDSLGARAVA